MTKSLLAGFLSIYPLLSTDLALGAEDAGRVLKPGETLVDQVRVRPNIVLTVKQTYATYPVLGQTQQEILSSLQQTPLHVHGSKACGETQWSWDGDYQVTAPHPSGRGFQLLRLQPARGRVYASLHWQEPTVLRPVI